jgi:hypothetical protein
LSRLRQADKHYLIESTTHEPITAGDYILGRVRSNYAATPNGGAKKQKVDEQLPANGTQPQMQQQQQEKNEVCSPCKSSLCPSSLCLSSVGRGTVPSIRQIPEIMY